MHVLLQYVLATWQSHAHLTVSVNSHRHVERQTVPRASFKVQGFAVFLLQTSALRVLLLHLPIKPGIDITPLRNMQACVAVEELLHSFLTPGLHGGEWSYLPPTFFNFGGGGGGLLNGSLSGSQIWSGRVGEEKVSFMAGVEPRIIGFKPYPTQPVSIFNHLTPNGL
jgi:hypothetical protein